VVRFDGVQEAHAARLSPFADIRQAGGKLIATSPATKPIEHRTHPGRHRLLALDARGAYDAVEVKVLSG
jgi:hypothetical protein